MGKTRTKSTVIPCRVGTLIFRYLCKLDDGCEVNGVDISFFWQVALGDRDTIFVGIFGATRNTSRTWNIWMTLQQMKTVRMQ